MVKDDLHNPVSNGKTKMMVMLSIIFLFIIVITSLVLASVSSFGLTSHLAIYIMKGIFGTPAAIGVGGLVGVTKKFFDTRTTELKEADKLAKIKENNIYKKEKRKDNQKYKLDIMKEKKK